MAGLAAQVVSLPATALVTVARAITVRTVITSARPGDLDGLAARALDGSLPEAISRRYRLEDGGRACVAFLHEHTRGKVVVVVSEGVAADRPGDL